MKFLANTATTIILSAVLFATYSNVLAQNMDRTGTLWAPYLEWSLQNPSHSENPYEVIATVKFTHSQSGTQHTTDMFYDENDTWKFRFAGTKTGIWTFATQSGDPELNGKTGVVTISPNNNPNIFGFITQHKNKWARQVGENGQIKAFVPNFVQAFGENLNSYTDENVTQKVNTFINEHGFSGIHLFMAGNWVDINSGTRFADAENLNPDPRSFQALERVIVKAHALGGTVHIWCYGDCEIEDGVNRTQCPQSAFGTNGARSTGEKTLLRYIGARLGALPGWIMGYAYDIVEHANTEDLRGWGNYLRQHMGWHHYLGARNLACIWCSETSYTLWPEADFYSRGGMEYDYNNATQVLDYNTNLPHSLDERFFKNRWPNMDTHRQKLWEFTMAGGVSAIWSWDGDSYPNPEQIKTHSVFWKNRFLNDMVRANHLTNGCCLMDPVSKHYVFYKQVTSSIEMNLSGMNPDQHAVAVDTKRAYQEIDIGPYTPGSHTWTAPYSSDWAISVGSIDTTPPAPPTNMIVTLR